MVTIPVTERIMRLSPLRAVMRFWLLLSHALALYSKMISAAIFLKIYEKPLVCQENKS
jgi:hypothetical protein